jgi:hypothetical protein
MLRRALTLTAVCGLFGAGTAAAAQLLPPSPPAGAPGHRRCGSFELFQHRFPVEAQGIGCRLAHRLLRHPCKTNLKLEWSCLSYRENLPFLIWLPSNDYFKRNKYPAVLLRRYPCSEAKVTPSLFGKPSTGFPTRRQLLADDVLRCELLKVGETLPEVEKVIGPADASEPEGHHKILSYLLGTERDSLIPIDPELLQLEVERGRLGGIAMVQGG